MRVPIFKGPGNLVYEDRPEPTLTHADEVIIEVTACGICGTDLNILATPPAHRAKEGIVIGHEAIGTVRAVGAAVTRVKTGDRVVVAPRLTCGMCDYCRAGLNNQCTNYETIGTTRDGGFAPLMVAPERALYTLSSQVDIENGMFFEPLSCAVGAVQRPPFRPGDTVIVLGGGPMGLLFALLYRAMGASSISVVDISPQRLDFCRTLNIAGIDASHGNLADQLRDQGAPTEANIVVDAVGNQVDTALGCVRRAGHIILFGLRSNEKPSMRQYLATRYDVTLHGVFVGLNPFQQTIQLLEHHVVTPSALITHRLSLSELLQGVELMRSGKAVKVAIMMSQ